MDPFSPRDKLSYPATILPNPCARENLSVSQAVIISSGSVEVVISSALLVNIPISIDSPFLI